LLPAFPTSLPETEERVWQTERVWYGERSRLEEEMDKCKKGLKRERDSMKMQKETWKERQEIYREMKEREGIDIQKKERRSERNIEFYDWNS